MPDFLEFQNMMILNLLGILFHAVVVFRPEHDFLFKSVSTYCVKLYHLTKIYRLLKTAVSAIYSFTYIIQNVENKKGIDLDLNQIN